jgi:hypothetical protein
MKSRVGSKGFWIVIALLMLIVIAWGSITLLDLKQRRDKQVVRAYIARVQPMLTVDPRFKEVRLEGYSCDNVMHPYMPIFGAVKSHEDWEALDYLIRTSKPPVFTTCASVRIGVVVP